MPEPGENVFVMSNHPHNSRADAAWIDLADLAGLLASAGPVPANADQIVDAMLAGPAVVPRLSVADLRASQWMMSSTPRYLDAGPALRVLMQKRGLRFTVASDGPNFLARVERPGTARSCDATAQSEGRAAVLALIQFVSRFGNDG